MPSTFEAKYIASVLVSAALVSLAPGAAFAFDADGDGIQDAADAFPCDPTAAAQVFVPAQGEHAAILIEDLWPERGDLDFNDLVLGYNYAFRLTATGRVVSMRLTMNVLAAGGTLNNGAGLHLPIARSQVQSVVRSIGTNPPEELIPSANDQELTVQLSTNVRELFGDASGPINSRAEASQQGETMIVDITFVAPVVMNLLAAPFDIYLFRTFDPSHEIHRPEFAGTAGMNQALFGTENDGSTPTRRFVDDTGLPFVLLLPEVSDWPQEATQITTLWPDIAGFAASGGTANRDFYVSTAHREFAYSPASGSNLPVARFVGRDHVPAGTGCISAWGLAVDFGSSRNLYAYGSVVAPNGDTVVTGYVRGALPGNISAGGLDLYVARYDGITGLELWARQLGGPGDDVGRDVAFDANGGLWIVGETAGGWAGLSSSGAADALLVHLDASGALLGATSLGAAGADVAYAVAVAANGDVIMAGGTSSANLPGANYGGTSAPATFVARYTSAGTRIWTRQFRVDAGDEGYDYALDVALDAASGAILLAGAERRSGHGSGAENQYAASLSSDGTLAWVNHIGDSGYASITEQRYGFAHGIAIDHTGAVYVTGYWYGGASISAWGDWARTLGDTSADATLTKIDASGATQWSYSLASTNGADDFGEAVAFSPETGLVFFTGRTAGVLPGQTSRGGDDLFVAAYDRDGVRRWLVQDGTAANDMGYAAMTAVELLNVVSAPLVNGQVFVVGNTSGALGGPDAGHWNVSIRAYDLQSSALQNAVIGSALGWTAGAWNGCAAACGASTETRTVSCTRADGVVVPNSSCVETPLASVRACTSYTSCNYTWLISGWSSCTSACGNGTQSRTVTCRRSDGTTVADDLCVAAGAGARPALSQSCSSVASCTYSWYTGAWSACGGASCGTGTQSRTVYCLRSDGTQVANGSCSGSAPATSQSCQLGACNSSCVQLGVDVRTLTQTASQYTRPRCGDASGTVCETSGVIPSGFRLATQAEGLFLSPHIGFGTCAVWTEGCWYWTGSGSVLSCTAVVSGCRTAGCTISGGWCYTAALLVRQGLIGTCLR